MLYSTYLSRVVWFVWRGRLGCDTKEMEKRLSRPYYGRVFLVCSSFAVVCVCVYVCVCVCVCVRVCDGMVK